MELLQANPHYAHVRYPGGREKTVATKHLASEGQTEVVQPLPQCAEPVPGTAENAVCYGETRFMKFGPAGFPRTRAREKKGKEKN